LPAVNKNLVRKQNMPENACGNVLEGCSLPSVPETKTTVLRVHDSVCVCLRIIRFKGFDRFSQCLYKST